MKLTVEINPENPNDTQRIVNALQGYDGVAVMEDIKWFLNAAIKDSSMEKSVQEFAKDLKDKIYIMCTDFYAYDNTESSDINEPVKST